MYISKCHALLLKFIYTLLSNTAAKPQIISQAVQCVHVFVSSTDIDCGLVHFTLSLMIKTRQEEERIRVGDGVL